MTVRNLVRKLLEFNRDLDAQVHVRLVRRDSNGVVRTRRKVAIGRVSDHGEGPCLVVEGADFDAAKEEPT